MKDDETFEQMMNRFHWGHVSFDTLARDYYDLQQDCKKLKAECDALREQLKTAVQSVSRGYEAGIKELGERNRRRIKELEIAHSELDSALAEVQRLRSVWREEPRRLLGHTVWIDDPDGLAPLTRWYFEDTGDYQDGNGNYYEEANIEGRLK